MEKVKTVSFDLIKKIYLHINRTEKKVRLLENCKKWDRLTSALNVLEDTSWAIEYYLESDYPTDVRGKYLYTYGLLQTLFVQVDAINSLYFALFNKNIDFKTSYPEAYAVRETRNDVTGHPTQRKTDNYIYLAQCSLEKGYFYYSRDNSSTAARDIVEVDVYAAISETADCVNRVLKDISDELDEEFKQYIEQHRDRKMEEIFEALQYAKEKALTSDTLGEGGYAVTKTLVQKCEAELVSRYGSVDAVDSYKYLLDEIHEIYEIIDADIPKISLGLQSRFQKYMLQLLFGKLEELQRLCKETDDDFERYGVEYQELSILEQ